MGFIKIFDSILDSTIWDEDAETSKVWITMLAKADRDGFVNCTIPGLANLSRVSREKTKEAIARFLGPDLDSRTKEYEGRRIKEVTDGWVLLNYFKYRELSSPDEVREKNRLRQQRKRERDREKLDRGQSYVYYIGNGGQVKIGVSRNPWARLRELRVSSPKAEILAYEPGTRELEIEMHRNFLYLRRDGEWFSYEGALQSHIEALRSDLPGHRHTTSLQAEAEAEAEAIKSKADSAPPVTPVTPPGLHPTQYAAKLLEDLVMSKDRTNLMAVTCAIDLEITQGKSGAAAYEYILARALDARDHGQVLDKFYFVDWGKHRNGPAQERRSGVSQKGADWLKEREERRNAKQ